LDSIYGIFTLFRDCQEEFYITSKNDIYILDELLRPHLLCADIVNDLINGASTTTETIDNLLVDIGDQMTLCENSIPVEIDATIPFATYLWNDGSTNSTNFIHSEGNYWVDVTIADCTKRDSIEIILQTVPKVDLGEDLVLCEGTKHVMDIPIEDVAFKWQDGSWESSFSATTSGTYQVEITKNGCKDTDQINIEFAYCEPVLEMPNVVTPNYDGKNDTLQPFILENISQMNTAIFDRLGKKVFKTDDPWINWAPIDQPSGVYYYYIEYLGIAGDMHSKKGWMQLLR
jgi:gliding motility-associated-like protein